MECDMSKDVLSHEEMACLLQGQGTAPGQMSSTPPVHGPRSGTDKHSTATDAIATDEDEQILRVRALSEHLAYNLSEAFSEVFRAPTHVDVGSVEQISYGEFLLRLDDPTCLVTLRTKDERASFVMEIELSILFPMIERMLGGDLDTPTVQKRPLTEIERRLAIRIVELFLNEWKSVCKHMDALMPETVTVTSNPCRLEALACKEAVTHIQFVISLGQARGIVSLVVPRRITDNCEPSAIDTKRYQAASRSGRSEKTVCVAVVLADTKLAASDVSDLQVGDVIDTEKDADEPLAITVDGETRFEGTPGTSSGHKAVRIQQRTDA